MIKYIYFFIQYTLTPEICMQKYNDYGESIKYVRFYFNYLFCVIHKEIMLKYIFVSIMFQQTKCF